MLFGLRFVSKALGPFASSPAISGPFFSILASKGPKPSRRAKLLEEKRAKNRGRLPASLLALVSYVQAAGLFFGPFPGPVFGPAFYHQIGASKASRARFLRTEFQATGLQVVQFEILVHPALLRFFWLN